MADLNSKDGCNSCIYFLFQENDFMGLCRRYPTYQNRHGSEWCGEFVIVPPNPVFETMVQDMEIVAIEKRKKLMEDASFVAPKPKGRPKKVKDET